MNPLFPLNEYVPDGEPHMFGNRVYLYGSHDTTDSVCSTTPCGLRP